MNPTIKNVFPSVIRRQYAKGMKLWQLANLYETDEATIQPIVAGIVQKPREEEDEDEQPVVRKYKPKMKINMKPNPEREARNQRIVELAREGLSQREIAELENVTQQTVLRILKEANYTYEDNDKRKKNRNNSRGETT